MGEIKLVFNPFVLKAYPIQMISLAIAIFLLIGITIYLVRKELLNDK